MDISYDSLVKRTISFSLLILLAASFKSTHFNHQVGMESQTDWEKTAFTKSLQKWFLSHVHLHERVEVERQLVLFGFYKIRIVSPLRFCLSLPKWPKVRSSLRAQVTAGEHFPESLPTVTPPIPPHLPPQLSHPPPQSLSLLPPLLGQAHEKRISCRPKARYGHCIFLSIW